MARSPVVSSNNKKKIEKNLLQNRILLTENLIFSFFFPLVISVESSTKVCVC